VESFITMLIQARADFKVRWCYGEEVPCWEVDIRGEKDVSASFTFSADGSILQNVFVA
jgi:hypothetical protein